MQAVRAVRAVREAKTSASVLAQGYWFLTTSPSRGLAALAGSRAQSEGFVQSTPKLERVSPYTQEPGFPHISFNLHASTESRLPPLSSRPDFLLSGRPFVSTTAPLSERVNINKLPIGAYTTSLARRFATEPSSPKPNTASLRQRSTLFSKLQVSSQIGGHLSPTRRTPSLLTSALHQSNSLWSQQLLQGRGEAGVTLPCRAWRRYLADLPPPMFEQPVPQHVNPITSVGASPQMDPTLRQAAVSNINQAKGGGPKTETSFLGRLRATLSHTQLLCLGHLASLFGVIALFMKDMLFLRGFMICGGLCGIFFNMLQSTPMFVPSMWGCVFLLINLTQVGILLNERREVLFSSDELDVFELEFQRHGVTASQFKKLMHHAGAEWRDLPADHLLLKQGDYVEDIYLIINGCAEVTVNGGAVGQVQRGSLVGETALLAKGHVAGASVTTLVPTKVVVWNKHKLRQVLANDPSLILSVSATINSDLANKLAKRNLSKDRSLETYKDVLGGICSAGRVTPEEKKALREFRERHGIRPAEHEAAVREVGWTLDEYDDGALHHSGRLAGLLSRVPRWHGRTKALDTMENVAHPHPADVPTVTLHKPQAQAEPQAMVTSPVQAPLKKPAASLPERSPLAVCMDEKLKHTMKVRRKDSEAALGAQETRMLYETLNVPDDDRGTKDWNFNSA